MKKITLFMSLMFIAFTSMAQTPIITMIADGDCAGGNPKVLEVYADGTVDFSMYSLENQTNTNTTWGNALNLADLGTLTDEFAYIYADDPAFATEFPSATNTLATSSSVMSFNGDDRMRIVLDADSSVIDQFGVEGLDGTGEAWEYKDGYAKRANGTTANGTFNVADWNYFNSDLDGQCGTTGFENIIEIGTFTPGTSSCPLVVIVDSVVCDSETEGATSDTYTATATFTGGGTETYTFTINAGTVTSPDDPSTMATGSIVVTNIPEGTDLTYTITSANCNLQGTVPSASCEPTTNVSDIATLRQSPLNAIYTLTGEVLLTYQQSFRGQKYIEDATGAILIDDIAGNITTTYTIADGITGITGELNEYNGTMQFIPESDPGAATSNGNALSPQVVTMADYIASPQSYESELIAFTNITFVDGDGTATFDVGTEYNISNGGEMVTMRTQFYDADYIGEIIPNTQLTNLVGIAARFDDGTTVTPQIFPRSLADFEADLSVNNHALTNVSLYPNPTNTGFVTIGTTSSEAASIEVYNLLGKQVIAQTLTNSTLNVSSLASGVYLVKVSVEGKTATKKLVIK
ncbi:T9SS type A sorting domain-containing protein [Mesonia sp. MT50]|uniref:T9SS type A sorting domain-containing protein n=1 Tax=Mesonia profundi TaxID=3070998 RepID=A0ABU0ZXR1_9FLAO|nr:T9SS type A sorting domain-containing protein [Mesonia profundi]MDQ7916249.1 T9SS type A sorting domain-containing protein [Mesonia profundi]